MQQENLLGTLTIFENAVQCVYVCVKLTHAELQIRLHNL